MEKKEKKPYDAFGLAAVAVGVVLSFLGYDQRDLDLMAFGAFSLLVSAARYSWNSGER